MDYQNNPFAMMALIGVDQKSGRVQSGMPNSNLDTNLEILDLHDQYSCDVKLPERSAIKLNPDSKKSVVILKDSPVKVLAFFVKALKSRP